MHIKSIAHTLHASSAQSLRIDLHKRQIITGRNFSGKTAILDAIALAASGYIPRLGKSNDKLEPVIGACQEAQAVMELIDNSGHKAANIRSLTLTKNQDGSISKKTSFDAKKPLTPLIIDPSLFLAAKPSDRMAMIQSAANVDPKRFNKLLSDITARFPLVKKHFSKSADLGEFATETEANLAAALKETKASLDRQIKATAAAVEHAMVLESVEYNEAAHIKLRQSVKQTENTIATVKATIDAWNDDIIEPEKPHVERPALTVSGVQTELRKLSQLKSDKNLSAKLARQANDDLRRLDADGAVMECHCCGAKREHWNKEDNSAERRKELEKIVANAPTDDEFDALEMEITSTNKLLHAAEAWERYDDDVAAFNLKQDKRVKVLGESKALLEKSEAALPGLASALKDMDEARDSHIAYQAQETQSALIKETRDKMEKEKAQLDEARGYIKSELTKLSNDMMQPILEKANLFTKDIINPLACANFRLGYEKNGQWVAMEAFSGCELAVATAAITAALMTSGDLKTIIIDEAQRIDPEIIVTLARNIDKAINDGVIEQAIIVGTRLENAAKGFKKKSTWETLILE